MNVLAYTSQKPEVVGAKVAQLLQQDLGAATPLPYEIETSGVGKAGAGTVLKEALGSLFGGKEVLLFTLSFNLESPRWAKLDVQMNRQGVGCHGGTLLYSARLAKKIAGEISLDDPKTFGNSPFSGDPAACAKLNANKDLLKKANTFACTSGDAGGMKITAPRFFKLVPDGDGALLVGATFGRPHMMGFKMSMRSKDFFELAGLIEAAL